MRRRAALVAAAAVAASLVLPSAAHADGLSDGLWWFEQTGVAEAQQTATGEGVTIAMFDSPVAFDAPNLVGADVRPGLEQCPDGTAFSVDQTNEQASHATALASILVGNGEPVVGEAGSGPGITGIVPDATLLVYLAQPECGSSDYDAAAYRDMLERGVDLVVSATGVVTGLGSGDGAPLRDLVASGTPFLMAVPNSSSSYEATDEYAVWRYNGVAGVETADRDGARDDVISGPEVGLVAPGAGFLVYTHDPVDETMTFPSILEHSTSIATAYTAGAVALAMSAAPEATGMQIMQSLVRTTGGEEHEPSRSDDEGYGFINLRAMLAVDPTQYPDENPFIRADGDPTPEELSGGGAVDPADPGTEQSESGDAGATALLVAGIVIGLVGIGVVVLAIVLIARRRAARTTPSQTESPAPRS